MSPHESIAHYRIVSKLGEGGMGAVYRATDTKLNRDVAIKVLPEAFAQDSARMQRFEREAEVLASLNHPNIAAIYGIEQGAIVMELVEGANLAGPLPVDVVMDYARQIATGLEAAHEKGIVHRDLKPANIKITHDGTIKILDFGLAKASDASSAPGSNTQSPTMSLAMTQAGMILGTAAYMSPEQAKGKPVDRRADIWAYGVILYELLTGRSLYGAEETVTETLAAVVLREPDFNALPAATPPRLRRLIERCLRKDPKLRLRDIGEARILLDEPELAATSVTDQPAIAATKSNTRIWTAAAALSTLALIALAAIHFREIEPPRESVRFSVPLPPGGAYPAVNFLALSPDGRKLAFLASVKNGPQMIWVRYLNRLEALPLPGTENASFPFWSPDSRYIAFGAADFKLKKVDLSGGPPQILCPYGTSAPVTGAWTKDGMIYFPNGREGIFRVPQGGGDPVRITKVDEAAGETFHAYPHALPDGRRLLVLYDYSASDQNAVYLISTDGKEKKKLVASIRSFGYAPPLEHEKVGHLLITRQDTLMALPVNPQTMEPAGDLFPIVDQLGSSRSSAFFSVSESGGLAYITGTRAGARQLAWFDRTGKVLSGAGLNGLNGEFNGVALSRDGARLAFTQSERNGTNLDLWLLDVARGIPSRFTFHDRLEIDPVWSPDSSKVAFSSNREGTYALYVKDSNGAAPEQLLHKSELSERASDWSPDGRFLMYVRAGQKRTLWTIEDPLDPAKRKAAPYLDDQHASTQGQFSPGAAGPRWVAYTSDQSQHGLEVFVQSFPAGAGKYQISTGGGIQPRWRRDGKELFYFGLDGKIMAVDVKTSPRFEAGVPHPLFDPRVFAQFAQITFRYDVTADGQKFVVDRQAQVEAPESQSITVVLNWLAGLKK
ncbi:MAG TPA: protein kinase [Candidatus Solibacter sp.]|nr:protein kinase [Candidatus Solibacter sp.]